MVSKKLIAPKGFYFAIAGAITSVGPFFALFYQQLGIPSSQIGILTGLPSLITLFGAALWTGLADFTHRHKSILLITLIGSAISLWLVLQGAGFWALLPIVGLYSFFLAPAQPLVDNAVLHLLGDEHKHKFGRQRISGSFAAGITGPLVSILVSWTGIGAAFYCAMAYLGLGTGFASLINMEMPAENPTVKQKTSSFWDGLGILIWDPRLAFFLLIVMLGMTARSTSIIYIYVYMSAIGAPKAILGLTMAVLTIGEVPFLFYSDRLLKRWGPRGVMIASLLCSTIMLFTFAWMRTPWLGIAVYLLHGVSYSGMWLAGVSFVNHLAPPGLGATAQGLFNAVFSGLAFFGGSIFGGLLYDRYGGGRLFFWAAILACAALGLFLLNQVNVRKKLLLQEGFHAEK
jgi:MFS transporter, PPP family, 3-phenylpropionic acid transporter